MSAEPIVHVVDDDEDVRDGLKLLIQSVGLVVQAHASAADFLARHDPARPGCLVLDLRMPGMSGLELQQRLSEIGERLPIIFITGHGDVPDAVRAMRAGAIDFLQKPFREQELLDRIQQALSQDEQQRARTADLIHTETCLALLTPREHEVLDHVVAGSPNKAIAYELGVSERTIEIHRSRVMKKMEARSLPELVDRVVRYRERSRGAPPAGPTP